MATEKWVAGSGVGFTWTDAFSTGALNGLSNGAALASSVIVLNQSSGVLDMYADLSIHLGSAAYAAPNYVGVYLYPLNAGAPGTVYGDGRFGTAAAGPPPANYAVGTIGLVAATQAQDGILTGIVIPPNSFKFVIYNQAGLGFATSGATCQYRTYNRSVA